MVPFRIRRGSESLIPEPPMALTSSTYSLIVIQMMTPFVGKCQDITGLDLLRLAKLSCMLWSRKA